MNPAPYSGQRVRPLDYGVADRSVSRFMNNVYAWMCAALAITACSAWLTAKNMPAIMSVLGHNGFILVALFIGLAILSVAIRGAALHISAALATVMFLVYAALLGMALSGIFMLYTLSSIAGVFIINKPDRAAAISSATAQ